LKIFFDGFDFTSLTFRVHSILAGFTQAQKQVFHSRSLIW